MGVCLSDAFEKGPVYTNSLSRCLLKWRMHHVAITGDIEKMFNQISLTAEDQRYHRFLWRDGDESSSMVIYKWLRVLFGEKPSPDLKAYALRFLAEKYKADFPRGASILEEETYVDDIVFTEESVLKATVAIAKVDNILAKGKFNSKVWNSNVLEIDQNQDEVIVDVLGHLWDKHKDTISMKTKDVNIVDCNKFTKRKLMGTVEKLGDPFGYLLPVSIQYRMWQEGYRWDQQIPAELVGTWRKHIVQMQSLTEICIERCVKPDDVIGLP